MRGYPELNVGTMVHGRFENMNNQWSRLRRHRAGSSAHEAMTVTRDTLIYIPVPKSDGSRAAIQASPRTEITGPRGNGRRTTMSPPKEQDARQVQRRPATRRPSRELRGQMREHQCGTGNEYMILGTGLYGEAGGRGKGFNSVSAE